MRAWLMWPPAAIVCDTTAAPWGTRREKTASLATVPLIGRTSAQPAPKRSRTTFSVSDSMWSTNCVPS